MTMITSPQNEKLKLVRRLRERKYREREGLFATEGEDLVDAGLAAGCEPRFLLSAAGSGLGGEEVEPELLASVSALGSGTRAIAVWPQRVVEDFPSGPGSPAGAGSPASSESLAATGSLGSSESLAATGSLAAPCVYLHGVADPGNVGAIVRTAHALLGGSVVLGPGCADPYSPKAVRASMGSIFSQPLVRAAVEATPRPRAALVAHGGDGLNALAPAATLCLGAEREGLPREVLEQCDLEVTVPLRSGGVESLNVAAAAAIACERISSPAMREVTPDA